VKSCPEPNKNKLIMAFIKIKAIINQLAKNPTIMLELVKEMFRVEVVTEYVLA
jgi:hypothetical protein